VGLEGQQFAKVIVNISAPEAASPVIQHGSADEKQGEWK